jgi:hypothetical protein
MDMPNKIDYFRTRYGNRLSASSVVRLVSEFQGHRNLPDF